VGVGVIWHLVSVDRRWICVDLLRVQVNRHRVDLASSQMAARPDVRYALFDFLVDCAELIGDSDGRNLGTAPEASVND
jgi:hypothetical protein